MGADLKEQVREPIGLSILVAAMMLVMLSHARQSLFAWAAFLLATPALILVNRRYQKLLRAVSNNREPSEGDEAGSTL